MTHHTAFGLHEAALEMHWLAQVDEPRGQRPGGFYWGENAADEADAAAWRATRKLFPERDFKGSNHAAMEAHWEADALERPEDAA